MNYNLNNDTVVDIVKAMVKDNSVKIDIAISNVDNNFEYDNKHVTFKDFTSYVHLSYMGFFIDVKSKPLSDNTSIIINKDDIFVRIEKSPKGFIPVVNNETLRFKFLGFIPISKTVKCTTNYFNLENVATFIIDDTRKTYTISQEDFDSILKLCNEQRLNKIEQDNLKKDNDFNNKMIQLANEYNIECKLQ